ncbi:MAG TPA: hypothetical protein ENK23_08115, partial [Sorangium sp.]|nr:hypothetical protein [Sorangium sp.]
MAPRRSSTLPPLLAVSAATCTALASPPAAGQEQLLHLGVQAGYATATLPELLVGGFGGGGVITYGVSDAFNLRLHGDVSIHKLPEANSLLLGGVAAGAEYLLDVLDWVPYAGLMIGPSHGSFQATGGQWLLGVEVPFGLGYRLLPEVTLMGEGRVKWLFLGDETAPTNQLWLSVRFEYVWQLSDGGRT